MSQVALAWLLAHETVTSVIIGARKMDQLEDNLKSVDLSLKPEDLQALDEVSRMLLQYPDWMQTALAPDRLPGQERRLGTAQEAERK